jgi:hypothetical protein
VEEPTAADVTEEEVQPEEEVASPIQEDEDSEDLDDFSNWNVPSWSELIASLYRPDR